MSSPLTITSPETLRHMLWHFIVRRLVLRGLFIFLIQILVSFMCYQRTLQRFGGDTLLSIMVPLLAMRYSQLKLATRIILVADDPLLRGVAKFIQYF